MRGKSILNKNDNKIFKAFVFGGILGDHPPQDRTSKLRKIFDNFRSLESV